MMTMMIVEIISNRIKRNMPNRLMLIVDLIQMFQTILNLYQNPRRYIILDVFVVVFNVADDFFEMLDDNVVDDDADDGPVFEMSDIDDDELTDQARHLADPAGDDGLRRRQSLGRRI